MKPHQYLSFIEALEGGQKYLKKSRYILFYSDRAFPSHYSLFHFIYMALYRKAI